MARFLTEAELYRLIQRELPPDDVYPDGAPSAYFSTADSAATAKVFADAYANMERIYENNFPQTADERLTDWEFSRLGKPLTGALTVSQRRERVLAQMRTTYSMNPADLIKVVRSIIGNTPTVEIIEFQSGDEHTSWRIGRSGLGTETYLGGASQGRAWGPTLCDDDPAEWGLTQTEWDLMKKQAYQYQVRITGYALSADEITRIDEELSKAEMGGAFHYIVNS